MSKKQTLYTWKYEIAVNGSEIVCNRFLIFGRVIHVFAIKIDFRGDADNFTAIRALNLQFEMQKAGSTHGTGSFFRVIFNFSVRKIFPAALADAAFHSPTAAGAARSRLAAAALYPRMLLLPLKASNLRSVRFFRHQ